MFLLPANLKDDRFYIHLRYKLCGLMPLRHSLGRKNNESHFWSDNMWDLPYNPFSNKRLHKIELIRLSI